ncbi:MULTISPECIES: carbamate kinase [unclassified Sporolactobacillus]|uniref:carbamate kinase n=1 Tax=unclassified Sporolactobacillus TaxID=2628533 RepID=UPI002368DCB5|nr:carbamate kinase [Sporolactobacillus sp. CQH2019]MDD9148912.1 carbamate kinase [Sporolactobacillus sp. CQH2019]
MTEEKKVVIALGGNAIETNNDATAKAQQKAIAHTAEQLVQITKNGYKIAITHGNGPQVGNILLQQKAADSRKTPPMPIDTCGAMSQGMIGYWMVNALDNAFAKENISKKTVNILTRSLVSANDQAFVHPVKPIGPFYSEEEAKKMMADEHILFKEDAGRGYRRVIASPYPNEIVEYQAIRDLMNTGYVVVAVGGGGVPVIQGTNGYKGVEAVIDKDFGAQKLAEGIDADILLLLTAVDSVYIYFNTPQQKKLDTVSVSRLRRYIAENHFAEGSMLPKIKAAISFVQARSGRRAIITSLDHAQEALAGGPAGTVIYAD